MLLTMAAKVTVMTRKRKPSRKKKAPAKKTPLRTFPTDRIEKIVGFSEEKPFEVLGPHFFKEKQCILINAFLPRAKEAWIKISGRTAGIKRMKRIHPAGFFQAVFENENSLFQYKVGFKEELGYSCESEDPYAFPIEPASTS